MEAFPGREASRVRHLFDGEHLALVIDAMAAGHSPATVWADDAAAPRAAAIWDGGHCLYIGGAGSRVAAFGGIVDRRIGTGRPGLVKIYATENNARAVFACHQLDRRERVFYRGERAAGGGWRDRLPAGLRISSITAEFGRLSSLRNFADVAAEVESCWPSVADFRRAGFGFCCHDASAIVCWCTAEYVSDGQCGIGIETIPGFQGRST